MRERRGHKRRRFWLPVEVDRLGDSFAVSHDASDGGLLLVTAQPLDVGTRVSLRFRIPPAGPVEVEASGSVVRSGLNDDDPEGLWPHKIAVEFDAPVPQLTAYLEQLDTPASG